MEQLEEQKYETKEEVKNEVVNIKCNHDKEQVVVPLENILAHIENHLSGGHEHE